MSKFKVAKIKMELLDNLYELLENEAKNVSRVYRITGEKREKRDWKTGDVILDDDGNPKMEDIWDYFDKEEDEYTDDDMAKLSAIQELEKALEKLA